MIVLYSALVAILAAIHFLLARRAGGFERAYARAAKEAEKLRFANALVKEGNSSRTLDTYETAKRTYQLGRKVEERDAIEALWQRWQFRADWFAQLVGNARDWKGRKLPYTMGLADMSFVLWLVDRVGMEQVLPWQHWLGVAWQSLGR